MTFSIESSCCRLTFVCACIHESHVCAPRTVWVTRRNPIPRIQCIEVVVDRVVVTVRGAHSRMRSVRAETKHKGILSAHKMEIRSFRAAAHLITLTLSDALRRRSGAPQKWCHGDALSAYLDHNELRDSGPTSICRGESAARAMQSTSRSAAGTLSGLGSRISRDARHAGHYL